MTILSAPSLVPRKRRRLERQLQALRLMSRNLWLAELGFAVFTIPFILVFSVLIMHAQGWQPGSIGVLAACGLMVYAAFWWAGRRWALPVRPFAWIVWLSFCILARTPVEPPTGLSHDKKEPRRAKLERAIARRIAMLNALGVTRP